MISVRRAFLSAIAAVLAVSATSAYAAESAAAARSQLSSQLPAGTPLAKASVDQTAGAVRAAVAQDNADATSILRAAIQSKEPKQGKLSCADVNKLTRAAIASDSAGASQLIDTASSLHPECADDLAKLLTPGTTDNVAGSGLYGPAGDYDFGAGFGPGFPGAPGFVGSAPSGGFALPPATPTPLTPSANS